MLAMMYSLPGRKSGTAKKEEDDDEEMGSRVKVKTDEDDDESDDDQTKSKRDEHDDLVRKVRYNLENHGKFNSGS